VAVPNVDLGTYCFRCGKRQEPRYIFIVIWHPDSFRRFLQPWCVECIARTPQCEYDMAPTGIELDRQDKIIGVSK